MTMNKGKWRQKRGRRGVSSTGIVWSLLPLSIAPWLFLYSFFHMSPALGILAASLAVIGVVGIVLSLCK